MHTIDCLALNQVLRLAAASTAVFTPSPRLCSSVNPAQRTTGSHVSLCAIMMEGRVAVKETLKVGASAEMEIVTTPEMGITHLGPDAPRMYSTPAMIGLMEQTSFRVLTPHLDGGEQSVGTKISVSHFKATTIGQTVRAKSTLTEIVDVGRPTKRYRFTVETFNEKEKIGEGTHERAVINVQQFAGRS
jgi:fluoroacetyl-CoA thioesterase